MRISDWSSDLCSSYLAVRNATGMEGGSDFIVGEAGSWQIDPETSIGLAGVASNYVRVNLTSRDSDSSVRKDLSVGEAIAYTSASGEACKIALHTINNARPGSASFSRICRSEEHTSELQSLMRRSYAVF